MDVLDIKDDFMLGFIMSSYCVGITCCISTIFAGIRQVRMKAILVSVEAPSGLCSEVTQATEVITSKVI